MKKLLLTAMSVLLLGATSAHADWSEDFNSGTLGTFTVDDILGGSAVLGWDNNVNIVDGADVRGNFTTGDAGAAHVDSDAIGSGGAGAYNIAMVSPVFMVENGGMLEFTHMFRSIDTGDFGHVEISTDGVFWTSIVSHADTVGTIPTFPYTDYVAGGVTEMYDLSAFAGSNAQIRFRYEGDSWDWWWQVDNVSYSTAAIPEPSSAILLALAGIPALLRRRK